MPNGDLAVEFNEDGMEVQSKEKHAKECCEISIELIDGEYAHDFGRGDEFDQWNECKW